MKSISILITFCLLTLTVATTFAGDNAAGLITGFEFNSDISPDAHDNKVYIEIANSLWGYIETGTNEGKAMIAFALYCQNNTRIVQMELIGSNGSKIIKLINEDVL